MLLKLKKSCSSKVSFTRGFAQLVRGELNDKLSIGDYATVTRVFTSDQVITFSDICGDKNPIHINEEAAAKTKFGKRIVHGILVGSLFSDLCGNYFVGSIYVKQSLNFKAPVFLDEEVEGKIEVINLDHQRKRIFLNTTVRKIKEDKLAITGEAEILYSLLKAPEQSNA